MPAIVNTPGCRVLVNGTALDPRTMAHILDVTVRDSLLLPDTAVVRFVDPDQEIVNDARWAVSNPLEVKFAGTQSDEYVATFNGEIVAIEPEYSNSGLIVSIRAYDKGWRLNRARRSKTYQDVTAGDMIKQIAGEEGLSLGTIERGDTKYDVFQQSMETNWEFCWRLARMHNCEFIVQGKTCHFRKRKTETAAETLVWQPSTGEEPLLSFKPRLSGMGQVNSVEVRNNDPMSRALIAGTANTPGMAHKSEAIESRAHAVTQLSVRGVVVSDRVAVNAQEATAIAQATLDRLASSFVEASGMTYGNPKVRAGTTVRLKNVHRFSGEYVLSETTHRFAGGSGEYRTSFVISGRTSHRFRDLLQTNGHNDWGSNLVIGIVTNNKETQPQSGAEAKLGRVKVKYPGLGDNIESGWARVAVPHAGVDRGMFFLPQVDDEVVIAFEHGDTRRPIVIGSLFNGRDKPPAELLATTESRGSKDPLFGIKTPHESFVESKQKMTLRSHEQMIVEIKKDGQNGTGDHTTTAAGKIEATADGEIKQTTKQAFTVDAGSSVSITGKGAVTIEGKGGVTLKGPKIDIQADAAVNIKGQIINLG
jgi:uncharacterized protein involved in type VI secretion and phage assembly